jgi:ankyrin repeat protein
MVELGATGLNRGLRWACFGGYTDCARLMVDLGATDLNRGLDYACSNGHVDCARLMVELGATACNECDGANHDFV